MIMLIHHRSQDSFYGRLKGKRLRPAQAERLATLLPTLAINVDRIAPSPLARLFPSPVERVCLEIGFGGAEHLTHEAGAHPDWGFIGVEPFRNGLAKAVTAIE